MAERNAPGAIPAAGGVFPRPALTALSEALGRASSGWAWARLFFAGLSRLSPAAAAWALHGLYSRPALTRSFSREERRLLREAARLMQAAERIDERIATRRGRRRLSGYLFRVAPAERRGLALLLHGWTADSRAMAAFVGPLLAAGYDALAVDLPAHGRSSGAVTDAESGAAAVRALLEARGLAPDHVIAHSFGGAVASVLAAEGVTPRAFVALAAPSAMAAAIEELADALGLTPEARARLLRRAAKAAGRPIEEFDARRIWTDRPTAILVVHSPEDGSVPFSHAERFVEAPNARLLPTPGIGHREIVGDAGAVAAALDHILAVDGGWVT